MAISSREKEVPTRLPAARLYLDDIKEICEIILFAAASRIRKPGLDPDAYSVETKFFIGDQVCTEIEDLPKIKKFTHDFEMRLSAADGFSARFNVASYATQWTTEGLTKADAWRAFHKLETVFERRAIRWRNLLPQDAGSPPLSAIVLFFAAFSVASYGLAPLVYKFTPSHTGLGSLLLSALIGALVAPPWFLSMRHSVVVLRYSWDQAAHREDRNSKILIAAASALIAFLLGIASMAAKHKFWP